MKLLGFFIFIFSFSLQAQVVTGCCSNYDPKKNTHFNNNLVIVEGILSSKVTFKTYHDVIKDYDFLSSQVVELCGYNQAKIWSSMSLALHKYNKKMNTEVKNFSELLSQVYLTLGLEVLTAQNTILDTEFLKAKCTANPKFEHNLMTKLKKNKKVIREILKIKADYIALKKGYCYFHRETEEDKLILKQMQEIEKVNKLLDKQ